MNKFKFSTFARLTYSGKAVMIDAIRGDQCLVTMVYSKRQFWINENFLKEF